ncbi:transferase [Candidatus Nitrotoga sp. M5]|uniref:spermine/spermidine synthase domain-containing protein n=1 Tax=Candidatus Nitrotoga sp. M5 TaxID=2890409 RepID=UPI001EF33FC1|nr:transferase [Candidatus Nitrotoga sp. M5]CAH1386007.1 PABS domain-containing protein [Candidatus Nitrotoga sp. M5]
MKNITKAMQQKIDQMVAWIIKPQTNVETDKPYLKEREGILALHFDALYVQSGMCIEEPDTLHFSYTRIMMSFLLFEQSPKHIAMIGLGGGSLAKYCYRYLPETKITVIEINQDVIALRNEFAIPADDTRFKVLLGDGAEWVTDSANQPNVLMIDGYDAAGLSVQLSSQQFYDDCFASLADNGIMVVNLWSSYACHDEYLARIHNSFASRLVVVETEDRYNKVVFAVKNIEFPPPASTIRHHAKLLCSSHPLNFQAKSNKLISALPAVTF